MGNQEYEKAKQECWKLYHKHVVCGTDNPKNWLYYAYDEAYRLGMEAAKKEMLTANVDSFGSNVESLEPKQAEPKYHVGEKVSVHYPTGKKIGFIKEVMLDGSYDVDFGGGCTGHGISEYLLEPYAEPQEDKHFDNIIKDGFRNERRLNIATQILYAIIPMFDNKYGESELTKDGEQTIVRNSFRLADMMIEESEKKGGSK